MGRQACLPSSLPAAQEMGHGGVGRWQVGGRCGGKRWHVCLHTTGRQKGRERSYVLTAEEKDGGKARQGQVVVVGGGRCVVVVAGRSCRQCVVMVVEPGRRHVACSGKSSPVVVGSRTAGKNQ